MRARRKCGKENIRMDKRPAREPDSLGRVPVILSVSRVSRNILPCFGWPSEQTAPNRDTVRGGFQLTMAFRMLFSAPFSNLETWAWEMPMRSATSIWVFPLW